MLLAASQDGRSAIMFMSSKHSWMSHWGLTNDSFWIPFSSLSHEFLTESLLKALGIFGEWCWLIWDFNYSRLRITSAIRHILQYQVAFFSVLEVCLSEPCQLLMEALWHWKCLQALHKDFGIANLCKSVRILCCNSRTFSDQGRVRVYHTACHWMHKKTEETMLVLWLLGNFAQNLKIWPAIFRACWASLLVSLAKRDDPAA